MSAQSGNQKRKKTMNETRKKNPHSDVFLNPVYSSQDFRDALSDAFQNKKNFIKDNGVEVNSKPFPHCILPDFLGSEEYVTDLQLTVEGLDFKMKHNDLYKFSQTSDFKSLEQRDVKAVTNFLYETFLPWMTEVTGFSLSNSMDLSASCYDYTDYLLCHNDQLSKRKIAFIYYLVSDWTSEDGGTLDFFDTCDGLPGTVTSSLVPKRNLFVFFEVTPSSYHQVSEVLRDKSRYAISGWYHHLFPPDVVGLNEFVLSNRTYDAAILSRYLNPIYLDRDNMESICCKFEDSSEIQLVTFLKDDVHLLVSKELKECSGWTRLGPPHERSYEALEVDSLLEHTKNLYNFLHSDVFSSYLSTLLGFDMLASVESNSRTSSASSSSSMTFSRTKSPLSMASVGKCGHRAYSLLHDLEEKSTRKILDAFLFLNCEDWDFDVYGGMISYVDADVETPLISLPPDENTFSLVYHEESVLPFLKYVNHKVCERDVPFFNFMCSSYYENEENGL